MSRATGQRPILRRTVGGQRTIPGSWRRLCAAVVLLTCVLGSSGCATMGMRSAVDFTVDVAEDTPGSALVYVDGQYIGTLAAVAARGVRLPEGKHRISVEKNGYFPYDAIVVSDLHPIHLEVKLVPLPD